MLSGSSGNRRESENILMRVLFCKINCPCFICFCKPSQHIYTSGALKLENNPNVPQKIVSVSVSENDNNNNNNNLIINEQQDQPQLPQNCLKSNLKKPNNNNNNNSDPLEKQTKTVQWMDILGKELVQIREFESCETEYFDYEADEMNRSCICVIL